MLNSENGEIINSSSYFVSANSSSKNFSTSNTPAGCMGFSVSVCIFVSFVSFCTVEK